MRIATLALLLAACGPKMIDNTNIIDTPDTRSVIGVLQSIQSRDREP